MDKRESVQQSIPSYNAWKLRARRYQQGMCNVIGKRLYDEVPNQLLHKKIGYALYGPPTEMKGKKKSGNVDDELTYTSDKIKKIEELRKHIIQSRNNTDSGKTYLAVLFIHIRSKDNNKEGLSVVFRILRGSLSNENFDDYIFIDSSCRSYKDWLDFLENNKLPKCDMCFPNDGFYSEYRGRVEISYIESAACRLGNKVLNCLDNTSTVLGVAATGVSAACLVTAAAPVVLLGASATIVATGAYDIGRNIAKLVDSSKHDESLSLKNSKSRGLWLGLATSSLGVVSTGGKALGKARTLFKAGEAVVDVESAVMRFIHASSLAVSGVTVINSLVNAVIKYKEGTLERIDILQFIDSCYFFINSLITTGIAEWLIGTVAMGDPSGMFFGKINNFSLIDRVVDIRGDRNYRLLIKLIGKNKYMPEIDLNDIDRIAGRITTHVRDVSSGKISWLEFAIEMTTVSTTVWNKFKDPVIAAINKLLDVNNTCSGDESIFIDPVHREIVYKKPDIARQLCLMVHKIIQTYVNDEDGSIMKTIFTLIFDFNSMYQSNFTVEFLRKARFVCDCVTEKFINLTDEYELARDIAESSCDNFNGIEFDRDFGFAGETDIPRCLLQRAVYHLLASVNEMRDDYEEISRKSEPLTCEPPCLETSGCDYYLYDCESASTDRDHWNLLVAITGLALNQTNATLFRSNDIVFIRPNNQNLDTKLVSFIAVEEDDSAVGILTVIKENAYKVGMNNIYCY